MNKRGFTLIELMIVIAIIGVMSSIIIVSLNNARLKAVDANIKEELSSIRRVAAIYYDNQIPNNYGNNTNNCYTPNRMFTDDTVIASIISQIDSNSGADVKCRADTNYFAVSASLVGPTSDTKDNWCVDSAGNSKFIPDPLTNSATSCN
jgi:prepilin-type N-terminal cleavage/methylation domain-containing protein